MLVQPLLKPQVNYKYVERQEGEADDDGVGGHDSIANSRGKAGLLAVFLIRDV